MSDDAPALDLNLLDLHRGAAARSSIRRACFGLKPVCTPGGDSLLVPMPRGWGNRVEPVGSAEGQGADRLVESAVPKEAVLRIAGGLMLDVANEQNDKRATKRECLPRRLVLQARGRAGADGLVCAAVPEEAILRLVSSMSLVVAYPPNKASKTTVKEWA